MRADTIAAFVAATVAFTIYVCTLAPGLYGFVDTPVFQFVGHVLGTAHNPGYPLYSLLSHAFGLLPLGTLAWRMNLFSAVLTAVAVGLTAVAARGLGASRLVSFAVALGFGLSRSVWNAALIAEVYALQSALVAATLAAAIWWGRTTREGLFVLAVGCAALAGANHTSIGLALPALVGFVLVRDPSVLKRPRSVGLAALAIGLGLLPYALVVWRTVHGGAYVHTQARTLAELADVVSGGQFRGAMLSASTSVPLGPRLAGLWATMADEMGRVWVLTGLAGLLVLLGRRWREGWLLAWLAFPFLSVPLWFEAADWTYMATPAWLALALCVAVALSAVADAVDSRWRATAAVAVAVVALWWPVRLFAWHLPGNDLTRATHDAVFFDALFDDLPQRAALVADDFVTLGMLRYKLLGEHAQATRDIRLVAPPLLQRGDPLPPLADMFLPLAKAGVDVRLFPEAARRAAFQGVPMTRVVLRESLSKYLADLPRGTWVGLALPAGDGRAAVDAQLTQAGIFDAGVRHDVAAARLWQVGGDPTSARPQVGVGDSVDLDGTATTRVAWTAPALPVGVRLTVGGQSVRAVVRGAEVVRATGRGIVVALHERGYLLDAQAFTLDAPIALGAPQPAALSLWRVTGQPSCSIVGAEPMPVTLPRAPATLAIRVPAAATMTLIVNGGDEPTVVDSTERPRVRFVVRRMQEAPARWNVQISTPAAPPPGGRVPGGFTLDGVTGAIVVHVTPGAGIDAAMSGGQEPGIVCAGS